MVFSLGYLTHELNKLSIKQRTNGCEYSSPWKNALDVKESISKDLARR